MWWYTDTWKDGKVNISSEANTMKISQTILDESFLGFSFLLLQISVDSKICAWLN